MDGILHTLSITGYDTAGNPSSVLSFENLYVDLAGPTITVGEYHPTVLQAQLTKMLGKGPLLSDVFFREWKRCPYA